MLQTFTYSTGLSVCAAPARVTQLGARPRNRKLHGTARSAVRSLRCDEDPAATAIARPFAPALRSSLVRKTRTGDARSGARPLASPAQNFRVTRPPRAAPSAWARITRRTDSHECDHESGRAHAFATLW